VGGAQAASKLTKAITAIMRVSQTRGLVTKASSTLPLLTSSLWLPVSARPGYARA
jgi:hypothetical protein